MWAVVNKQKHNAANAVTINGITLNADVLNRYFASVATDPMYDDSVYGEPSGLSSQEASDADFTLYDYCLLYTSPSPRD